MIPNLSIAVINWQSNNVEFSKKLDYNSIVAQLKNLWKLFFKERGYIWTTKN